MGNSAFDLIRSGIQQSRPVVSSFVETGVDTGNSARLNLPTKLPDSQHFMALLSYKQNKDDRGNMIAFGNLAASGGFKTDNVSSDGFTKPVLFFPLIGVNDVTFNSSTSYAVGDRMNILVAGTVAGSVAAINVVIWDETSGTANLVYDYSSPTGATSFEFTSRYPGQNQAFFASGGGQRPIDLTVFRTAWWDLPSPPPDITNAAVMAKFFDTATGSIKDPAIGNTDYGDPLFDIYGDAANFNAGTNFGTAADFIPLGTFTNAA